MAKEVMHRSASDNVYLHKDFHGALSAGIEYIDQHYGPEAVREYLRQFAASFYAPLTEQVKRRGLAALKERIEDIYGTEGGSVTAQLTDDELMVEVDACPAVAHMCEHGYAVAGRFLETSKTVYETVCEGTPFAAQWLEYDARTGRSRVRFHRRPQ